MSANKKGFSLIELMLVMCIIALLASFAIINTRYLHKAVIHSQIDLLFNTCYYLQKTAMATGQIQELIFDEQEHRYSFDESIEKLSPSIRFGILPDVKGPPSSPHHSLNNAITFVDKKIKFYPDGIISSGIIYLIDQDRHDIYALSSGVAHTSFLRKYRYDGKWHLM